MYTIQKASIMKRMAAFLLDFILMTIAVTGFAFLVALITNIQGHVDVMNARKEYFETKYYSEFGITEAEYNALSKDEQVKYHYDFDISQEDYSALSEENRKNLDAAYGLMRNDEEYLYAITMVTNLTLIMITMGLMTAFILLELVIPKIFGNGQTVGKKVFSLGVVHVNAVKLTGVGLFTRTMLGKYTVEVMIPVMMLFMMLLSGEGLTAVLVLGLLIILEIFAFFRNRLDTPIHDVLSHTVCVDMSVQQIYENEEELIKHKQRLHEELARESDY